MDFLKFFKINKSNIDTKEDKNTNNINDNKKDKRSEKSKSKEREQKDNKSEEQKDNKSEEQKDNKSEEQKDNKSEESTLNADRVSGQGTLPADLQVNKNKDNFLIKNGINYSLINNYKAQNNKKYKVGNFVRIIRLPNSNLNYYKGYNGEIKKIIGSNSAYISIEARNSCELLLFSFDHFILN
jgi:hypothetical protein